MARVLMKGCEAIAEAAVRAGCRFFAGYPISEAMVMAPMNGTKY